MLTIANWKGNHLNKKLGGLLALSAAGVPLMAVAPAAGAASWGSYHDANNRYDNNGCTYTAYSYTTSDGRAFGETIAYMSDTGCSKSWVQVHYRDAKGNLASSVGTGTGTNLAQAIMPSDGTFLYACHSSRSASAGNWSTIRKSGPETGAGGCGTPA